MKFRHGFLVCAAWLTGCGSPESSPGGGHIEIPPPEDPPGITADAGRQSYLEHCAGCHETGLEGAPVVGDRAYWKDRSQLWQAVLVEHARQGYIDMPAKGGRPELASLTIDAAVEYMMELTYPEMPPDQ